MNEIKEQRDSYLPTVRNMRMVLMACAMLYTFGSASYLGDLNGLIFGFAFPALYIISGYLILNEDANTGKRILRAIGRTALCFVILFAVYFGLSLIAAKEATLAAVTSGSFWKNLIFLNIWTLPVGSIIWYVQALLYAYIIIFVIYKLKLIKLDIFIAVLCLAVAMLVGELAGVIGFNFYGRAYIGGNFLTRALPYILIGSFIRRKKNFFENLETIIYWIIIIAGLFISAAECFALVITKRFVYGGHLLGMGVVAVGICLFTFFTIETDIWSDLLTDLSRFELALPFFVSSPVYVFCTVYLVKFKELFGYIRSFAGIITLIMSFVIVYIYSYIRMGITAIFIREDY